MFNEAREREIIAWMRIADFQLETMKMIASAMLRASPNFRRSSSDDLALYIPGEVALQAYVLSRDKTLIVSAHNPGAL